MKDKWKLIFGLGILILFIILILLFIFQPSFLFKKPTSLPTKDKYIVSYTMYVDGSLYEQKNISFFEGEFARKLGLLSDINFDNRSIGEEFNITLMPSEAFGEYKEELRKVIPRTIKESRFVDINYSISVDKQQLEEKIGEVYVNQTIKEGLPFPLKVIEVNDKVILAIDAKVGDKSENMNGLYYEIIEINKEKNKVKLKTYVEEKETPTPFGNLNITMDENYIYLTLTPKINETIEWANEKGKVKNYNQTHIILDDNHPLAGKEITLTIKILDIKKEVFTGYCIKHENAPELDVFIMSYCPFGIQFIKGLLPVWKEFSDKANINVRFVSYTMHGQKEVEENTRMICIREEQCEKYMAYLECFAEKGDAQGCVNKVGIDQQKLNDCMANRANQYLAYDAMLNEKYGVRGSPTVVINGQVVEVWPRSPANIARILCQYFDKKPEECNMKFSETNPSAGFGYGVGSGGGSCG